MAAIVVTVTVDMNQMFQDEIALVSSLNCVHTEINYNDFGGSGL